MVVLNLFVAIQDCLDLATHWLAAAAAFRNLVAHQYGGLDWRRVYELAASDLGDLDTFCATLAGRALS